MKFFNIDLHISIIADMKKIFTDLGHDVTDKSLSEHTWVFNRKKDSIPMLDNGKWRNLSPSQYSDIFYNEYKHDMDDYDGFIVTYPPPFSLLYRKFDKPIIINNPIRYEWPFSFNSEYWKEFNDFLREGVDNNKIFLVANNMYDKLYMEGFIERPVEFIPSICDYYKQYYKPERNDFIYYYKGNLKELNHPLIKHKDSIFKTHRHEDLLKFKGIIHIPYQISYMSIFEQYTSNVPIFVPSKDFLIELYQKGYSVLNEMSWNKYSNRPPRSFIGFNGEYDPNDYSDIDSVKHWVQFSDFYDDEWMPYIIKYDSFNHLKMLVETVNTNEISDKMSKFNKERQRLIYDKWNNLLNKIKQ